MDSSSLYETKALLDESSMIYLECKFITYPDFSGPEASHSSFSNTFGSTHADTAEKPRRIRYSSPEFSGLYQEEPEVKTKTTKGISLTHKLDRNMPRCADAQRHPSSSGGKLIWKPEKYGKTAFVAYWDYHGAQKHREDSKNRCSRSNCNSSI